MNSSATTARILVNGKPVKIFTDQGGLSWVEAREGTKYQIEVKNNSANRVLCVTSIDGINVISGEEADLKPDNGYIINPFSNLKIDGWRISDDKVKEFLFTYDKSKSYSVKLGAGAKNLGVIGMAIYEEKKAPNPWLGGYRYDSTGRQPWFDYSPSWTTFNSNGTVKGGDGALNNCTYSAADSGGVEPTAFFAASCSVNSADEVQTSSFAPKHGLMRSASVDFHAGTAKGKEVESQVRTVEFTAGSLIQTHSIYYDSFDHLVKRGVITENKMPQPFKTNGYCRDI